MLVTSFIASVTGLHQLHPLNFFIGGDQFIPDLHHQLKRHICLLQRHHRMMKVLRLAGHEITYRLAGSSCASLICPMADLSEPMNPEPPDASGRPDPGPHRESERYLTAGP